MARGVAMSPIIEVRSLQQYFHTARGVTVRAVEDVSFALNEGEVVGLVGESGSGKTTIGQAILRLINPTNGQIIFRSEDITHRRDTALRSYRRHAQPIFQDPYGSLNPRMNIEGILSEPLQAHGLLRGRNQRKQHAQHLLAQVGLPKDSLDRYPHQFSGGQRQRIAIARALALAPSLIVADEPVSALDVSIQAQIVNLLRALQREYQLAMLFIAHDLAVVEYISDRIIVLYLGRIMEIGPSRSLISSPKHPYTEALISAVPEPGLARQRRRIVLSGDLPSPADPPSGCVFRTRCSYVLPACSERIPELRTVGPDHQVACIRTDVL
jgi:oligopeptide/dipeptide ABC transporter ATP-binding protein